MENIIREFLFNAALGKIVGITIGTGILWAVLKVLEERASDSTLKRQ